MLFNYMFNIYSFFEGDVQVCNVDTNSQSVNDPFCSAIGSSLALNLGSVALAIILSLTYII